MMLPAEGHAAPTIEPARTSRAHPDPDPVLPPDRPRRRSAQHRVVRPGDVALTSPPPGKAMATFFRPTPFRRFVAATAVGAHVAGADRHACLRGGDRARRRAAGRAQPVEAEHPDDRRRLDVDALRLPARLRDRRLLPQRHRQDGRALRSTAAACTTSRAAVPTGGKIPDPAATSTSSTTSPTRRTSAPPARSTSAVPGAGCELVNPPFRCSTGIDSHGRRYQSRRPQDLPRVQRRDQSDRLAAGRQAVTSTGCCGRHRRTTAR